MKEPVTPCRSRKVGAGRVRPHHLSVMTLNRSPRKPLDHLPGPGLRRPRRALRVRMRGLRPQDGVAVAEERVGVGHPVVCAPREAQDCLAAPQMLEPEP